jgi:plasmid stability protein
MDRVMPESLHCSYNAGMPVAITIRNVPERVRDELAARAARSGRSLQEYLAGVLTELTARPMVEDAVADARKRARTSGRIIDVADILADRDAERR